MDLPSFNMPPVLENMFKHLLNTYGHIRGWNIYENDKGFINLNIRFSSIVCEDIGSGSHARLEPVMYINACLASKSHVIEVGHNHTNNNNIIILLVKLRWTTLKSQMNTRIFVVKLRWATSMSQELLKNENVIILVQN